MFRASFYPCALALAATLATLVTNAAQAADLTLVIDGIDPAKGVVKVAVFDRAEDFDATPASQNRAPFAARLVASGPSLSLAVTGLAPGRYAASAYQDRNGNGQLDFNQLGIPTEPYGFSNVETPGRPSFAAAAADAGGGPLHVHIHE